MSISLAIIPHGSPAYREAVRLREAILRAPLGRSFTAAELAAEWEHIHMIAREGDEVVATLVLVPEGSRIKMQRVAVAAQRQGCGIGSALLGFAERHAKAEGFSEIYCHARHTAVDFYLHHAYAPEGEPFDEDGIPHLMMRKNL